MNTDSLAIILPFVASCITNWMRATKLPASWNAIIAFVFLVATSFFCVWLTGGWSSDPHTLTLAVLAEIAYLMQNDLKSIASWLSDLNSPIVTLTRRSTQPTIQVDVARPDNKNGA